MMMFHLLKLGLLDEHFMALQSLQDAEDPDFIAGLVMTFLNDGDRMFGELTQLLERLFMDFDALYKKLHELKGCSARVRLACIQLLQFIGGQHTLILRCWPSLKLSADPPAGAPDTRLLKPNGRVELHVQIEEPTFDGLEHAQLAPN
ncbi:hypothetical protein EJB05_51600, partial [Eragrostis curvula]